MMALLFLFTPPELLEGLEHTARSLGTRRPSLRLDLLYRGLAILGVAATFLLWAWGWQRAGYMSVAKVGFVQYLAWAAVLATVFCLAMRSDSVRWDDFHARLLPANAILWLFPVLITLNGMSPYLGSKTQTSFAMFSNLRTEEDRTNHLLMPGSLQIWDLQRDTVEIVESNHPKFDGLRKNELRIPYIQFRLDVGRYDGDIAVTYLRNGALKRLQRSGDQIDGTVEALEPLPYLARKWLRFRPFNIGPKMECRH
jgi:hypothetical protein